MQKKRKQEKANEGPHRSPATASRGGNDKLDKGTDTELRCDVSRMTSIFRWSLT